MQPDPALVKQDHMMHAVFPLFISPTGPLQEFFQIGRAALVDIMSALSVIWKRNLSHFRPLHTLVLPTLLYKYKDQNLVK